MRPNHISFDPDRLATFCHRWKISELAVFGSVLRDDFRRDSDVDVLVRFQSDAHWAVWDLGQMEEELTQLFGRQVDLLEWEGVEQSRNPIRRQAILSTAEVIHAA